MHFICIKEKKKKPSKKLNNLIISLLVACRRLN